MSLSGWVIVKDDPKDPRSDLFRLQVSEGVYGYAIEVQKRVYAARSEPTPEGYWVEREWRRVAYRDEFYAFDVAWDEEVDDADQIVWPRATWRDFLRREAPYCLSALVGEPQAPDLQKTILHTQYYAEREAHRARINEEG